MIKILPLLLLTHNLNKSNCIGPCFGACPSSMMCVNGECCDADEPDFSNATFVGEPPDKAALKPQKRTKGRAKTKPPVPLPLAVVELPKEAKKKPLPGPSKSVKVGRLITPIPSIPQPEFPLPSATRTAVDRRVENRSRLQCVDHSPSCAQMKHMCVDVVYRIFLARVCTLTCNQCGHQTTTPPPSKSPTKQPTCQDEGNNCASMAGLCGHPAYQKILRERCCRTCFHT
ncbi:ShTK domain protein [Aphelenchoides fujianensis]|nr:ShTK domain protein [Aphelenchoides fujianensis]